MYFRRLVFQVVCGWVLAWLLIAGGQVGIAQRAPLSFETISTLDGLSHRTVYAILQDRHGFMWFGTADGLNRYDGYSFVVYRHLPSDPRSLSNNTVTALVEDRHGYLWVGTSGGGLNRFDPATETFRAYQHAPDDSTTISGDHIQSLYEDRSGYLWVGMGNGVGLNRFDPATETFVRYRHLPDQPGSLSADVVTAITEDAAGRLWIGAAGGLNRLDRASGRFTAYSHPGHQTGPGNALRLYPAARGGLWVGWNSGGVDYFDPVTERFTHYGHGPDTRPGELSHASVRSLLEDTRGRVWFGTYGYGLRRLDPATGTITSYRRDPGDDRSLARDLVIALYEDRAGLLWCGTWSGGLSKAAPDQEAITRFVLPANAAGDPPHLSQLAEDRTGDVWATTWESGLLRLNRATGAHRYYRHNPNDPASLATDSILAMTADQRGQLWLGMWVDAGLDRFDPVTGTAIHYRHDAADAGSLSDDAVNVIHEDQTGTIWVGTRRGGLNRYDPAADAFTRYYLAPNTKAEGPVRKPYITSIADGNAGTLWVGTTQHGLLRFDPAQGRYIREYRPRPNDSASLPSDAVSTLLVDQRGQLWVGLAGQGLARFDPHAETFTHYDERDGLANGFVHAILEDDNGHLWMSTNQGLSRFDPEAEHFENYDLDPSLHPVNVEHAALRNAAGELFFGAAEAFFALFPDRIAPNPYAPNVVLTRLERTNADSLSGLPQVDHTIYLEDDIVLTYKDRILTFEVAALSYYYNKKNHYAYQISALGDQWIDLGTQRRFSFTNLDPGTYTLAVRGSNNDGVWSTPTTLRMQIMPPWWGTRWAYLAAVLLVGLIVVSLVQSRIRRIALQKNLEVEQIRAETLHELDEAKNQFFANISHEFRTPLTLILGPLEDLQDGFFGRISAGAARQIATAVSNGHRLLRLVNQLLDVSRLEAGRVELQARPLDMTAFVEQFIQGFIPMAERKQITLRFEETAQPGPVYTDPEQFEKVLANLLGNALKFTPEGGTILITLGTEASPDGPETMVLAVHDDGPGIAEKHLPRLFERFYQVDASSTRRQPGTGVGLALVKHLVDLHHGTIDVESKVDLGTTFTIRLPLGRAHLSPAEIAAPDPEGDGQATEWMAAPDRFIASVHARHMYSPEEPGATEQHALSEPGGDATTVLIVDDNPDMRAYVRRHLARRYRVLEAPNGLQALDILREHLPDLVVSDVMMPDLDGFELCRTIKQDPELDFIPVILLTAKAAMEHKIEGLKEGADDYLTKPFNVHELEVRVENLIASRQRLKALYTTRSGMDKEKPAVSAQARGIDEDAAFAEQVRAEIAARLSSDDFDVDALAAALAMGRTTLYRRLGNVLGQTPMELIWQMRLERAAALLRQHQGTVSEVAYGVGFKSVAHFSNRFRETYGLSPSAYAANHLQA